MWHMAEVGRLKIVRLAFYLFAFASAGLVSGSACAESIGDSGDNWRLKLNANFSAPGSHNQREDHRLYRIDFECKSNATPLPTKTVIDLIAVHSVTTSHSVIISKDYIPADATTGKLKIPDKPLRLLTPYSMNGSNVVDNREICPKSLSGEIIRDCIAFST